MSVSELERVVYVFDDYRLDRSRLMLYRGDEEIALPRKAVETLIVLVEMPGQIVRKEELMTAIWPNTVVEDSNLTHHIHVLRKIFGNGGDGSPVIETLRGRGYRFNPDVKQIGSNGAHAVTNSFGAKIAPPDEQTGSTAAAERKSSFTLWAIAAATIISLSAVAVFLVIRLQKQPEPSVAAVKNEISIVQLTSGDSVLSATISPDGKYFVYHEVRAGESHLWLQQVGETSRIEIIPAGERSIGGKTFSRDSESIYFLSLEKGEKDYCLYRVGTLGGQVNRILCKISSAVSFSPDGGEMVFARDAVADGAQLVIASSTGEKERILMTLPPGRSFSLGNAWSPDGSTIAYAVVDLNRSQLEGNCSIEAIDVLSRATRTFSAESWDTCYRVAWTNDGAGLILIGTRTGESYTARRDQVYYVSAADGRSRRVSSDFSRYQADALGITGDNSILAVPTRRISQIWSMDASGDPRSAVQLTNGPSDGAAGIAALPDGRVGYISRTGDELSIWTMNADGSDRRQIDNKLPFIEELRATPDGRYFVFSARRDAFSHLYRIDTDGRNLVPITSGSSYEFDSAISPDSRWVYYAARKREGEVWKNCLRKTSIDGGETIELGETQAAHVVPSISPDGMVLALASDKGLQLLSSQDGTLIETVETDKQAQLSTGVTWSSDGRSLTYLVYREHNVNIWKQQLDRPELNPITNLQKGYIFFHAYSADGGKLYLARGYQSHDAVLIKDF